MRTFFTTKEEGKTTQWDISDVRMVKSLTRKQEVNKLSKRGAGGLSKDVLINVDTLIET